MAPAAQRSRGLAPESTFRGSKALKHSMTAWLLIFLKGILAGMIIAVPVGPVAVICIKRSIYFGVLGGLSAGFGAAVADAVFGAVVGFGIAAVTQFLAEHESVIQLVGGIILLVLGLVFILRPGGAPGDSPSRAGMAGTFLATFTLTMTNPATILTFLTVFSSLGLATANLGYDEAAILVAGVFLGSAIWWVSISLAVLLARGRIGVAWMPRVKRWSGVIVIAFGIYALWSALSDHALGF